MSTLERHDTRKHSDSDETILVLTDGSDRAERVAEWALIFADVSRTTAHRIDVVECLDSGVIIHRYNDTVQNEYGYPRQRFESISADETTQNQKYEPTPDVLHGEPHEVLLSYVAENTIDLVIIGVRERTHLHRSSVGNTLATVTQTATVPVILIGGTAERSGTRCSTADEKDSCADRSQ